jgi:hypothetical protein
LLPITRVVKHLFPFVRWTTINQFAVYNENEKHLRHSHTYIDPLQRQWPFHMMRTVETDNIRGFGKKNLSLAAVFLLFNYLLVLIGILVRSGFSRQRWCKPKCSCIVEKRRFLYQLHTSLLTHPFSSFFFLLKNENTQQSQTQSSSHKPVNCRGCWADLQDHAHRTS